MNKTVPFALVAMFALTALLPMAGATAVSPTAPAIRADVALPAGAECDVGGGVACYLWVLGVGDAVGVGAGLPAGTAAMSPLPSADCGVNQPGYIVLCTAEAGGHYVYAFVTDPYSPTGGTYLS